MAPSITGTNCLTQAEDAVVELLANLSAFQAFVGVGDALSAKARIHVHDIPQTDEADSDVWSDAEWLAMFPCALIREPFDGQMFDVVQSARDRSIQFNLNLRYSVAFEAYATPGRNEEDQARFFMNYFGAILEEIHQVANAEPGEFDPTAIRQAGPFYRRHYAKREELGDVIGIALQLEREVQ